MSFLSGLEQLLRGGPQSPAQQLINNPSNSGVPYANGLGNSGTVVNTGQRQLQQPPQAPLQVRPNPIAGMPMNRMAPGVMNDSMALGNPQLNPLQGLPQGGQFNPGFIPMQGNAFNPLNRPGMGYNPQVPNDFSNTDEFPFQNNPNLRLR